MDINEIAFYSEPVHRAFSVMLIGRWTSKKCYNNYVKRYIQSVAFSCLKDNQSYDIIISSFCKKKLFKNALRVFDDVIEKNAGCLLKLSTYADLCFACSSLKSLEYGRKIYDLVLKSNVLPNTILENHIINMYGKCGSIKDAKKVFNKMEDKNAVTWSALLAGHSQNGLDKEAVKLYIQMQQFGFIPSAFTFGSVIKSCANLAEVRLGAQLHGQVIKSQDGSHIVVQNALITMYSEFGRIDEAHCIFSSIKSKELVSWSSMIAGFSKLGYELEALYCFKEMLSQSTYCPNEFIFGSVFSACGSLDQPEYGRQVHGLSIKCGFQTDIFAGCSLTDMYAKCGFLCSARVAFDRIESPDVVSWNAMIAGFAYGGYGNDALTVFSQMRHHGSKPNDTTVLSLLRGFAHPSALSQGKQVHSYAIKTGLNMDTPVCTTLLTMYANCSDYTEAYKMFGVIRDNGNLVSWNAIITVCIHQHQVTEVFSLFRNMRLLHVTPDHITLGSMLRACGMVSSLETGDQIYCCAIKYGIDFDIMIMNGSIDMYVKCGSLEKGRKIFDCIKIPDVFSWTSLIVGYAQFGYGEEALSLFTQMKSRGIKPNQVTMVGVLTACSHVGLVEEGLRLFKSMEQKHGVIPTKEHFSCIVDLLGRAGRITDAEAIINETGVEPDIVMWKTLLAACRNWGNMEVGQRAAANILKIDPSNSTAHVLLCSMFASAGFWKDVASLRSLMREKGVKKTPGKSWIEVKDRIHVFSAEDGLHDERDRVFAMVEELWLQILDVGFVPSIQ